MALWESFWYVILSFMMLIPVESTAMREPSNKYLANIQEFLDTIIEWQAEKSLNGHDDLKPFITITFAQSLDSKIALYTSASRNETSSNYPLSSSDSLLLTHGLRSIHDGILVGGRTFSIDCPRLTNRLWGFNLTGGDIVHQPRPIVLDSKLKHLEEILLSGKPKASNLIVCCDSSKCVEERRQQLMKDHKRMVASVSFVTCPSDNDGKLNLHSVLKALYRDFGIKSLMVEGGASILSSFAREKLLDCFCITISPKIIGERGLPAFTFWKDGRSEYDSITTFHEIQSILLENDCILLGKKKNETN